jgi:hypothetical protein
VPRWDKIRGLISGGIYALRLRHSSLKSYSKISLKHLMN